MDPAGFDELMSQAKTCSTASIRLPGELVALLKVMAKLEGERGYQSLVRKWISERLQHGRKWGLKDARKRSTGSLGWENYKG